MEPNIVIPPTLRSRAARDASRANASPANGSQVAANSALPPATTAQRWQAMNDENTRLRAELAAALAQTAPAAAATATAPAAPAAPAAPPSAPPKPTADQQALLAAMREANTAQAKLAALQAAQGGPTAAAPSTPTTAEPEPASDITMLTAISQASGGRLALSLFVPILAAVGIGTAAYELAIWGIATVLTVSSFALWPILIGIVTALVAVFAIYKIGGWLSGYIVTAKADEHAATVWGWLSSPFRSVETLRAVERVDAKLDHLVTP
jgi:hypothetical protein